MIDSTSPTWIAVEGWLRSRIESMRAQNDGPIAPDATAFLRGRIAFAKELLGLPEQIRMTVEEQARVESLPRPEKFYED